MPSHRSRALEIEPDPRQWSCPLPDNSGGQGASARPEMGAVGVWAPGEPLGGLFLPLKPPVHPGLPTIPGQSHRAGHSARGDLTAQSRLLRESRLAGLEKGLPKRRTAEERGIDPIELLQPDNPGVLPAVNTPPSRYPAVSRFGILSISCPVSG